MAASRLLLLSSSRTAGTGYLAHAREWIHAFLGDRVKRVLFVPYAGVTITYDNYATAVRDVFEALGYTLDSLHEAADPVRAVEAAECIVTGGGNTFHLLHELCRYKVLEPIRKRALSGVPYIGWSAGSNMACPTLRTTNDMPIVEPPSFQALSLVPFQINPHYTEAMPSGHQGETRAQRIAEFLAVEPKMIVAGLREGGALRIEGEAIELLGKPLKLFRHGAEPQELPAGEVSEHLKASKKKR